MNTKYNIEHISTTEPIYLDGMVGSDNIVHKPESATIKYEYVDLGLPSGLKWATMNIGATSETDAGLYFQWGDTKGYTADQVGTGEGQKMFKMTDYKYCSDCRYDAANDQLIWATMSKYNENDNKDTLESSDDSVTAHWGSSWRTPTKEEYDELISATTRQLVLDYNGSGVSGYVFTSKTDNTKRLFFPTAGVCDNGQYVNNDTSYWSSSNMSDEAFCLYDSSVTTTVRSSGLPVRGVCN